MDKDKGINPSGINESGYTPIRKPKTSYYIHRGSALNVEDNSGNNIYIEHSRTDCSGIGFPISELDGIIYKLQKIKDKL